MDHVSAVSEANGGVVPVGLAVRSSLSIQPLRRKPLAGAADAERYGNSNDLGLKRLARLGLCQKVVIDAHRCISHNQLRHPSSALSILQAFKRTAPTPVSIHAAASTARAASLCAGQ